jgi:DNA polymerase III gamma/tau subunit
MPGLQVRWRPQSLDEIVGNKETIEIVRKMFEREATIQSQAWHISGDYGTGKTTLGRIIAKMAGADGHDIHEINGAKKDSRGISAIEKLEELARFGPISAQRIAVIIDEAQQLTKDAKAALLKMVEDTPEHMTWIFISKSPEQFPPDLLPRCTLLSMRPVTLDEMKECLRNLLLDEGFEDIEWFVGLFDSIYKASRGVMRDAIKILDTIVDLDDRDQMLRYIQTYVKSYTDDAIHQLAEIPKALLDKAKKPSDKWHEIVSVLQSFKTRNELNVEQVRHYILASLRNILYRYDTQRVAVMMGFFINNFYDSGEDGLLLALYQASHVPGKVNSNGR